MKNFMAYFQGHVITYSLKSIDVDEGEPNQNKHKKARRFVNNCGVYYSRVPL